MDTILPRPAAGVQPRPGRPLRRRPRARWVIAEALECARPSADPRRSAIAARLSTRGGDGNPITVSSDPGLRFRAVDAITDLAEELAI